MADTNLSVKMLALGIISKVATGMGQPFDKYLKLLVAPVCSVCTDQKATARSAALATLSAMADATGGLDGMYFGLGASVETPNPVLRASVLGWLAERVKDDPPSSTADMSPLAGPIIRCLEDRNGDVRKGAGAVLPFVVASAGFDFVMDQTSSLKPASKATIVPLITAARSQAKNSASAPAPTAATAVSAKPAGTPSISRVAKTGATARSAPGSPAPRAPTIPKPSGVPARSLAMKALSSVPTSRAIPAAQNGDERPSALPRSRMAPPRPVSVTSQAPSSASSAAASRPAPFITSDPAVRTTRLKRDATRWLLDSSPKASADLNEYLQTQMEPHVAPELFSLLYSKDHRAEEDYMAALAMMSEFYDDKAASSFSMGDDEIRALQMANVDLALKYAALKLLGNNSQLVNRCLELISTVVELMTRNNERFSDAEAKLFVPALIFKYTSRLVPIFESLDKVIAGSQVVGLLVQFGLDDKSAGKTCKNETLALIEKAYRKRGSILRTRDDKGFYETVARCISDSGTRMAALSVMALLQLQGESKSLSAVVESMPQSSKDMLANRRSAMAASKSAAPAALPARASAESLADAQLPPKSRPVSMQSPRVNRTVPAATASPAPQPKIAIDSPSGRRTIPSSGIARPETASRTLQKPSDVFGANGRSAALQPLGRPPPRRSGPDVIKAINEIRHDDLDRCVDALKVIQHMLTNNPEAFIDNVETLSDTLMDELDFAFTPPENLRDPQYFRVVKHLIQSFSGLSSNQDLMRRMSYEQLYAVLSCLSLRLVQADKLGGPIQDMSRFFNLVLVQCLSTPDRLLVFQVMFRLLLDLTRNFSVDRVMKDDERSAHPDLVIKCLWKRCKILDDDFRSGRLKPGPLLAVLEDFLQGVSPSEYRRRAGDNIALGDMPLRTVKTIIQKMLMYTEEAGLEVYDILLNQFGDDAASTIVYTYVFRLAGRESRPTSSRPRSPLGSAAEAERPESAASRSAPVQERPETEAERLVKALRNENQARSLDGLYAYIKSGPEAEAEVNAAIVAHLTPTFQTYVRRAIDQRKASDNPSPARPDHASPVRSPTRPESTHQAMQPIPTGGPRKSINGPRPSSIALNVDKNAPLDDQLAHFKNVFRSQALNNTSREGSASPPAQKGGNGEVLGEIQPQEQARARTGFKSARSSDVD
ncbi:hypothetical protein IAU60_006445 [Kwoniella sp. DSM 27419]